MRNILSQEKLKQQKQRLDFYGNLLACTTMFAGSMTTILFLQLLKDKIDADSYNSLLYLGHGVSAMVSVGIFKLHQKNVAETVNLLDQEIEDQRELPPATLEV